MVDLIDWPMRVLPPQDVVVYPNYMTRPEQAATNGMRRSPGVTAAAFKISLIDIPVYDEATVRTFTAMIALIEGNSGLVRMRVPDLYAFDGEFTPVGVERRKLNPMGVPFAADVMFSSGVGFATSYRNGVLAADAPRDARTVLIADEEELPGGTLISIDDFTYTMRRVWMDTPGVNTVEISPVLRKAAVAGAEVEYAPNFVGICTTVAPGAEPRKIGRYGFHTLEFVEDLTRLATPLLV